MTPTARAGISLPFTLDDHWDSFAPRAVIGGLLLAGSILLTGCSSPDDSGPEPTPTLHPTVSVPVASGEMGQSVETAIKTKCAACHLLPEPGVLPKRAWPPMIMRMFEIDEQGIMAGSLDQQETINWYTDRAPVRLEVADETTGVADSKLDLRRSEIHRAEGGGVVGAVSNVQAHRFGMDGRTRIVATDMANGLVMMADPDRLDEGFRTIAEVPHPARTSLTDLDQDGQPDLLAGDLGSFEPAQHENGQAIWLRGEGDGAFSRHVLGDGFGRIVDVEAADFDGDGDLDVVVGEFGSLEKGGLWLLENITSDWNRPEFVRRLLDGRGGPVHTALGDFDGDGALDIVALRAEHYEDLTVYFDRGGADFERRVVFQAPHPSWGYSGLEVTDFDLDGDPDLLLTNGDGFDAGGLLQPFHGVQLLLNQGDGHFVPQPLMPFRGAHRAEAGDIDGDGDQDIAACAFHPFLPDDKRVEQKLDAVVWYEQVAPLSFERHAIEVFHVDCATLDLKDFDGDGDLDLVTGVFRVGLSGTGWHPAQQAGERAPVVITWENLRIP